MIETILSIAIAICIVGGCLFLFCGALGIIRFPDVYCRMHAATMGLLLGMSGLMLALILFFAGEGNTGSLIARCLLTLLFICLTNPIGSHYMAKNAYRAGIPLWEQTVEDQWQGKE
ncbi:MAG: monovalent cation/H(+) antiporter subunit G [Firmicutes bacterium]|nr:monovalent cation/H(+) antiporter subunit G [Bacillota bacterium]